MPGPHTWLGSGSLTRRALFRQPPPGTSRATCTRVKRAQHRNHAARGAVRNWAWFYLDLHRARSVGLMGCQERMQLPCALALGWHSHRGIEGDSLRRPGWPSVDDMDNRAEVREFLISRRARITPEQVGLPAGTKRRVPGLRRNEVAALARLSVEYYIRLVVRTAVLLRRCSRVSPRPCTWTMLSGHTCSTSPTRQPRCTAAAAADVEILRSAREPAMGA